jgi:hypothetical protein
MITSLTVDIDGIVNWSSTNTVSFWVVEQCFSNGTCSFNSTTLSGGVYLFDAYTNGFPGGYNFRLYGLDEFGNLIEEFYLSTDTSKFQ